MSITARSRSRSAASMPSVWLPRTSETLASRPPKETICSSLWDRAVTNNWRFLSVVKRFSRPSDMIDMVWETSASASRISCPLPSNMASAESTNSPSGPVFSPLAGLRAVDSFMSCSLTPSHSTGTAVRSTGIVPPSAISGPPVKAGVSWMKRSATSDCATSSALASSGTDTS